MIGLTSLLLLASPLQAAPSCLPVESNYIEARHLAGAVPAFSRLEPETHIFAAPAPGVLRFVHADEIRQAAKLHGIVSEPTETICFSIPLKQLQVDEIVSGMQREIGKDQAAIEVMDYSRELIPNGSIVFPQTGLAQPPNGDIHAPLIWRGYVQYTPQRRMVIWAKVRVSVLRRRVFVTSAVKAGSPVLAAQLLLGEVRTFPFNLDAAESLSEVVGMTTRRALLPGSAVMRQWLVPPVLIEKGETVTVESRVGAARLILKATAETSGRLGGMIVVRNPTSGRFFQAKVVASGKVEVGPAAYSYLLQTQKGWAK